MSYYVLGGAIPMIRQPEPPPAPPPPPPPPSTPYVSPMSFDTFLKNKGYEWRDRIDYGDDGSSAAGWGKYYDYGEDGRPWRYLNDDDGEMSRYQYEHANLPSAAPAPPPPPPPPPAPEPQIDWDAWAQITRNYEAAKDQEGGWFSQITTALDDSVNDAIPGGWATVAAVAVAVATGYVDPTLFATEAGTTALATEGAATLTAAEMATLTEASLAVDTAMAGAGGVGAGAGTVGGAAAFTGATETGLGTLAGEGAVADTTGATLLGEGGVNWANAGQSALTGAGKGVASNVLTSALTGREITPEGLAISAITGGAGAGAGNLAGQYDFGSIGSGAVSGGVGGTTGALLTGGDVGTALTRGALSGGIGGAGGSLISDLDPATRAGVQSVTSGLTNAALTGNTDNLLPNLIASGLGSAGATAAFNGIKEYIPPTGGTQKAEIDALDPMTQQLADLLYNSDTGETGQENYPTAGVTIEGSRIISDADAYQIPKLPPDMVLEDFSPGTEEQDVSPELDPTGSLANQTTSPLSPSPAQQDEVFNYYNALVSQGIEPTLATKMSGYTPSGTSVLAGAPDGAIIGSPTGSPTGTPSGSPSGSPTGSPTGSPLGSPTGTPNGTGTSPISTATTPPLSPITTPTAPTNPDLSAGELTVEGSQDKIQEQLAELTDAQKQAVTDQVKQGTTLTLAIRNVQGGLTNLKTNLQNQALSQAAQSDYQASQSALSNLAGQASTPAVTAPLSVSATSLAGAPVYNNNPQLLAELKQLYPQLSTINPKLLNMLGASPQGTPPLSQSAQVAKAQEPNDFMTNFMGKGISSNLELPSFAGGGHIHGMEYGHVPEFITGATGNYVKGRGDGQSDDIPAMLADGEYVFDADTVAQLGNGSSDAGAKLLDHFRHALREHKRSAPVDKIPPKASPLAYMKEALKRHSEG